MATSNKVLNDKLREKWVGIIKDFLETRDDEGDVLRTGSNELTIPDLDDERNDKWIQIVIKVPTGSRDGEPFDGYELAEDYKMKLQAKAEKKATDAEKKAKKIERDKKMREEKRKRKEAEAQKE